MAKSCFLYEARLGFIFSTYCSNPDPGAILAVLR